MGQMREQSLWEMKRNVSGKTSERVWTDLSKRMKSVWPEWVEAALVGDLCFEWQLLKQKWGSRWWDVCWTLDCTPRLTTFGPSRPLPAQPYCDVLTVVPLFGLPFWFPSPRAAPQFPFLVYIQSWWFEGSMISPWKHLLSPFLFATSRYHGSLLTAAKLFSLPLGLHGRDTLNDTCCHVHKSSL